MSDEILAVLIMIAGTIVLLLWVPALESLDRAVKGFRMSAGRHSGNLNQGAHAVSVGMEGPAGVQSSKPHNLAR